MRRLAVLPLLVLLAGCPPRETPPDSNPEPAGPTPVAAPEPAFVGDSLRDEARLVLERYCSRCHNGTYDSAIPEALAIFDLTEVDWARNLTAQNDPGIFDRLESGMGNDGSATPDEIAAVRKYLDTLYTVPPSAVVRPTLGTVTLTGPEGVCLRADRLPLVKGTPVQVVMLEEPQAVHVAEAFGTCAPGNDPAVVEGKPVPQTRLKLPDGVEPFGGVAVGVVGGSVVVQDGVARVDVNGDGKTEQFSVCTSSEGLHFGAWTRKIGEGKRHWHAYHYLGYDVEPSCSEAESTP